MQSTAYDYDENTYRLIRLQTTRPPAADSLAAIFAQAGLLQDLRYVYDPVGNITRIADVALRTFVQDGQVVEAFGDYIYDPLYRLTAASGREHGGQTGFDFNPADLNYRDHPFAGHRVHANDLQGLRGYVETYRYDAVGNLMHTGHHGGTNVDQPGAVLWNRHYQYALDSNRLLATSIPGDPDGLPEYVATGGYSHAYGYDEHGSMVRMSHLPLMRWDFRDQLSVSSRQVANNGGAVTTYYTYDAAGQRVRKVTEGPTGARQSERTYAGGWEVYREYSGQAVSLERETLHVMDDQQRIALVETKTAPAIGTPVIRYQLSNHLGSASLELDAVAAVLTYEEYHPYGTTAFLATGAAEVSVKRYRYTGRERDEETGLAYHGARYYAPWLGRWVSADPAGITKDGPNLYLYSKDAPLSWTDPTGLDPVPRNIETMSQEEINARYHATPEVMAYAQKVADESEAAKKNATPSPTPAPTPKAPATAPRPKPEELRESVPVISFFIGVPMQYVRPHQTVPAGAPNGLATLRQLNGQPAVGAANFSRDIAPGTSVTNMTLQTVSVISAGVGVLAPLASDAARASTVVAPLTKVAVAEEQTIAVHRFADITDMQTLLPRAAATEQGAAEVAAHLDDTAWLAVRAEQHSQGFVANSPFVSVGTDPAKLATSTDPWLRTIATGSPGAPGVQRAPFILTFEVPASRLISPQNTLAVSETEKLFVGGDLPRFLVGAKPNPH